MEEDTPKSALSSESESMIKSINDKISTLSQVLSPVIIPRPPQEQKAGETTSTLVGELKQINERIEDLLGSIRI